MDQLENDACLTDDSIDLLQNYHTEIDDKVAIVNTYFFRHDEYPGKLPKDAQEKSTFFAVLFHAKTPAHWTLLRVQKFSLIDTIIISHYDPAGPDMRRYERIKEDFRPWFSDTFPKWTQDWKILVWLPSSHFPE